MKKSNIKLSIKLKGTFDKTKAKFSSANSQQNFKRIGLLDTQNAWYSLKFHSEK